MLNKKLKSNLIFIVIALIFLAILYLENLSTLDKGSDNILSGSLTESMARFILELSIILIAAKLGGFLVERYLKAPSVIGEIIAGIIISPYALGKYLFTIDPHHVSGSIPFSSEIYAIGVFASIILLFISGLETDFRLFLRYSHKGFIVGFLGFAMSFLVGDLAAVYFLDGISSWTDPAALFLGIISSATSVGITARILSEKQRLSSPEGVTVLSAAVIDDILGMIALALLFSFIHASSKGDSIGLKFISLTFIKSILFCILSFLVLFVISKRLVKFIKSIHAQEFIPFLAIFAALLFGGLSENFGLAMIIGAFIVGLSLSHLDIAHEIERKLLPLYQTLVPVFFCTMGMLLDLSVMMPVLKFGLIYTLLCIAAKVLGCGLPTMLLNFNLRGATRIGIGMMPRGEVALIIAGIGLSLNLISKEIFGVAIMMTFITTLITPPVLSKIFDDRKGTKKDPPKNESIVFFEFKIPLPETADFFVQRFTRAFATEEFYIKPLNQKNTILLIRKEDISATLTLQEGRILFSTLKKYEHYIKYVVFEELIAVKEMTQHLSMLSSIDEYQAQLLV